MNEKILYKYTHIEATYLRCLINEKIYTYKQNTNNQLSKSLSKATKYRNFSKANFLFNDNKINHTKFTGIKFYNLSMNYGQINKDIENNEIY